METQGHGQGQGPRSPSPPPPPPSYPPHSHDAQLSSHESMEDEEEAAAATDAVSQEAVSGAAALPPSVDVRTEVSEEHEEEGAGVGEEQAAAAAEFGDGPAVLTDDLRDKIVRQVEYYFSDENLPTDKFMLKYVKKDKQGFVPIAVIASFRKMKKLVMDLSLIEAALRTSSQLVVSTDGRKVRRLHPMPITAIKDTKSCTVIVENLPDDYSMDNLQKIFANAGKILNITIHDPHSTEESKSTRKSEMAFSSKLHALIEYETMEAAANAVATLNDDKNWRSGMRVKLLRMLMGKYGLIHREHKGTFSEKNKCNQTSEIALDGKKMKPNDHCDDKAEKEEDEHLAGGKGRHTSRYRGRGRGQQNGSGQGHGQIPSSSGNAVNKPPPGPRMPDGTRGFMMGRGMPSTSKTTETHVGVGGDVGYAS